MFFIYINLCSTLNNQIEIYKIMIINPVLLYNIYLKLIFWFILILYFCTKFFVKINLKLVLGHKRSSLKFQ